MSSKWSLNVEVLTGVQSIVCSAVLECSKRYGFDGEEACRELGLSTLSIPICSEKHSGSGKSEKVQGKSTRSKDEVVIHLPYNGEKNESCCSGLKENWGLFTQCKNPKKDGNDFCKVCQNQADKNVNGEPTYGTISKRASVDVLDFKDPQDRSPTPFVKVMKKFGYTKEQVLEEASRQNITIDGRHFLEPEGIKRGRPKSSNNEEKAKGAKGRPKKEKKVLELSGDSSGDLFEELVKSSTEEGDETSSDESEVKMEVKVAEMEVKVAEMEVKKGDKSAEKKAAKSEKKAAKSEKKAAKSAEKAVEKVAEKAVEKVAEKAVEIVAEKAVEKEQEKDEEADVVRRFEYDGKKYLKSKKTGVVYSLSQDVIGKWNDDTKKVDFFVDEDEEVEEDYEEDEEEEEDE
jgi:hypothetical protein